MKMVTSSSMFLGMTMTPLREQRLAGVSVSSENRTKGESLKFKFQGSVQTKNFVEAVLSARNMGRNSSGSWPSWESPKKFLGAFLCHGDRVLQEMCL